MVYGIKLALCAAVSIFMAAALSKKAFLCGIGKKAIVFWLAVLPFIFVLRVELLTVVVCFVLLFLLKKNLSPSESIALFIAVLAAVPDWSRYSVSLPGINRLIDLYFWKVAVIALLVPLLFQVKKNATMKLNVVDFFVILLCIYLSLMELRQSNFTSFLRVLADNLLLYVIPYWVVSRCIVSVRDFHNAALGFSLLTILLSCVFFISQIVKEDFYQEFNHYSGWIGRVVEYRAGFLRLSGPFMNVLVGYLMGAGCIALLIIRHYLSINKLFLCIIFILFFLTIVFSGSRGAALAMIIALSTYFYFVVLKGVIRYIVLAGAIQLAVFAQVFDVAGMLAYEDEHGTFDYRAEMYAASFDFIKTSPLFGDAYYLSSGYFDHLVQGQGIIDVVSVYLQVTLEFGFVGLFLFGMPFVFILLTLLKQLMSPAYHNSYQHKYTAMYFSLVLGYLLLIGTTSTISLVDNFGFIMLGFCRSLSGRYLPGDNVQSQGA